MERCSIFAHENIVKKNSQMDQCARIKRIDHDFKFACSVFESTKNLNFKSKSYNRELRPMYCRTFKIPKQNLTFLAQNRAYQSSAY